MGGEHSYQFITYDCIDYGRGGLIVRDAVLDNVENNV